MEFTVGDSRLPTAEGIEQERTTFYPLRSFIIPPQRLFIGLVRPWSAKGLRPAAESPKRSMSVMGIFRQLSGWPQFHGNAVLLEYPEEFYSVSVYGSVVVP